MCGKLARYPFLGKDFLLQTPAARCLYHEWAASEPILDYHTHLPPDQMADDTVFLDLATLWLGGDHYKWRQMRAAGVPEAIITGREPNRDTFRAWAATVPALLGNPLYHWTHLELQRHFGIDEVLCPSSADRIWDRAAEQMSSGNFRVSSILQNMGVRAVCTTDDPADDLSHHSRYRGKTVLAPTFRPDRALAINDPSWPDYITQLGVRANLEIRSLSDLMLALERRHTVFHNLGCRLSDHGLGVPPCGTLGSAEMEGAFRDALSGKQIAAPVVEAIQTLVLSDVARLNHQRGWTMQLHFGVQRDLNQRMFRQLGPNSGFDAMLDQPVARPLAGLLDRLNRYGCLPRVILYSLNPTANDVLGSLLGCFQDGTIPGKVQLGSAWWFNDHIDGMTSQLKALANLGVLSRFVGMLTDSRSFLSFPRHEYFRRILCDLVGGWIDRGLVPDDEALVGGMVKDICYRNAREFFRLPGVEE